jgi:hypothetical protein
VKAPSPIPTKSQEQTPCTPKLSNSGMKLSAESVKKNVKLIASVKRSQNPSLHYKCVRLLKITVSGVNSSTYTRLEIKEQNPMSIWAIIFMAFIVAGVCKTLDDKEKEKKKHQDDLLDLLDRIDRKLP